jgi:hypothetical protein
MDWSVIQEKTRRIESRGRAFYRLALRKCSSASRGRCRIRSFIHRSASSKNPTIRSHTRPNICVPVTVGHPRARAASINGVSGGFVTTSPTN